MLVSCRRYSESTIRCFCSRLNEGGPRLRLCHINLSKELRGGEVQTIALVECLAEEFEQYIIVRRGGLLHERLAKSACDGVRIVPRPGQPIQLDFPVFMTGEIDGTVLFERDGRSTGAGRVDLQLLYHRGLVIKTIQTAFDGFFVFSNVPVGKYQVRVAPEQISELQLQTVRPLQVEVTSDKLFFSGALR